MKYPRTSQVTDGIYCIMRKSYFTCSYLATTDDGIVAIDAGMKTTGADVLHALEELGRPVTDVHTILLTHWHNDHAAGAAALAERSGAKVYYHARETDRFTRETAAAGLRARLAHLFPENGPLVLIHGLLENAPDRPVQATGHLADGDVVLDQFEVIETPGHTVGHLSFYDRKRRVLFAGDALAVIGGRVRCMARPVTLDLKQARESMLRCLDRPIDTICPGHREPLTNAAAECGRMIEYLKSGGRWPIFG